MYSGMAILVWVPRYRTYTRYGILERASEWRGLGRLTRIDPRMWKIWQAENLGSLQEGSLGCSR